MIPIIGGQSSIKATEAGVSAVTAALDEATSEDQMKTWSGKGLNDESERPTIAHTMMMMRRAVVTTLCSFLRTRLLPEAVGLQVLNLNQFR